MTLLAINGTQLHVDDSGPAASGETILFSHGLLWSGEMFAAQVAALRGRYRCVAYDHRGQGRSAESTMHSIDLDTLTRDAVTLIERLGIGPVHFVGLSMGGFVGMRLAARHPALLRSLSLLETTAGPEPRANVPRYRAMNFVAKNVGVAAVTGGVLPIMFGKSFLKSPEQAEARQKWTDKLRANRRSIWRAVNGVIDRPGIEHELGRISVPTLVIVGEEDVATPPDKAERIREGIAGARLVRIPRAGHSSTIEQPEAVNEALSSFLNDVS